MTHLHKGQLERPQNCRPDALDKNQEGGPCFWTAVGLQNLRLPLRKASASSQLEAIVFLERHSDLKICSVCLVLVLEVKSEGGFDAWVPTTVFHSSTAAWWDGEIPSSEILPKCADGLQGQSAAC
mmetsp:Transcript_10489/g.20360  ORF Transcript_10489/g.20360 Transcript_10489/m.20360 type:complete len:125 (-) Transcript_10489:1136-1510(-)